MSGASAKSVPGRSCESGRLKRSRRGGAVGVRRELAKERMYWVTLEREDEHGCIDCKRRRGCETRMCPRAMPEWPCGATWSARPTSGALGFPLCAPDSRATARAPTALGLVQRFSKARPRRDNSGAAGGGSKGQGPSGRAATCRAESGAAEARARQACPGAGSASAMRPLRPCRGPRNCLQRDRRSTDSCQFER